MGSDVSEVQETPLNISGIRVHQVMCTQFVSLLERIYSIFRDIEAVRPRCTPGIEALCLLQNAMEKAKKLFQNCRESSKLYLALSGETIVLRFERTKNHLVQSLSELQNMVPVALQSQIKEILYDLSITKFQLELHEKEAGRALRSLLEQGAPVEDSVGKSDIEVLQFVALRLHLITQKDLLIERRSILKLLNEVAEEKPTSVKTKTLKCLLYLLKKHKNQILQGQPRNPTNQYHGSSLSTEYLEKSQTEKPTIVESQPFERSSDMLDSPSPPEEFKCPLSSKLMNDPVVISSGQTFERTYIQKWFDVGHDTCPKTRMKLADLSVRPNNVMRDLISKWSIRHGIMKTDPNTQTSEIGSLETSSNSICSNASSMRDLNLQMDISNLSLGSLDSSHSSGFSNPKVRNGFSSLREQSDVDSHRFQFYRSVRDFKRQLLLNLSDFPWESQCQAVQDVKDYMIKYNPSYSFFTSENFLEPLVKFLKEALEKQDSDAQKAGIQLLLAFLKASRKEATNVNEEEVFNLLSSFLETDATAETLAVLEILSIQPGSLSTLASSGALTLIIKHLDSNDRELQAMAFRILYHSSLSIDSHSFKFASNWISKLVPFLRQSSVAGTCIGILENLCKFEVARISIVQTVDCISSIIDLLDAGSCTDQEHAISILLSLCSQREDYCNLVLCKGIEPALRHVQVNGSDKGKIGSSELLRLLMDVKREREGGPPGSIGDANAGHQVNYEKKSAGRVSGSFGRKMKMIFKRK